jgi:CHASE2 domain-containing sensor protein/signal transduction histidine kinase
MKIPRFSPFLRRVALREWFSLTVAMLLFGLILGWQNGLGRADQTLYDNFLTHNERPARDDIIIVAIDDYSLAELGRWPWPRKLHASLLDRLTQAGPRAVGLDIILSEPERAQSDGTRPGDDALAEAIKRNGRVILPIVIGENATGASESLPVAEFTGAARALGHINLEHDDDGVVRSVYLIQGEKNAEREHFTLALLNSVAQQAPQYQVALPKFTRETETAKNPSLPYWQRFAHMHIPYAGTNGHFQTVPYVSVLRGEVPAEFFKDKIVLVGATAVGLGDAYPTPVSGSTGAMPGVEINANILASLLDHQSITIASAWQTALFSAFPVLLAMIAYIWLSPRMALLVSGCLIAMIVLIGFLSLRAGLWLAPSAALLTLVLSYPLWSWRRLEAAITYLGQEFIRLDHEPHLLPENSRDADDDQIEDILERRINAMKNAARRVRDLRQFVSDSLDNLPDATLITRTDGRILLPNRKASSYFASHGVDRLEGAMLLELLSDLHSGEPLDQTTIGPFEWSQLLDLAHVKRLVDGVSVHDVQERDLLVKSAPFHSADNVLIGWIVSIIDISTLRAAERSRDETLRFLSHDMRSPQASILALLELQNEAESALPQAELFSRIEKASRRTLGLADNFVQLARAESHEYRFEEIDFQDILLDATDEMWTQANGRQIKLITDIPDGDYPIWVDRGLMTRAIVNLVTNAINYSLPGTTIRCVLRLASATDQILCHVIDQGTGIPEADQSRLFRRFQRLTQVERARHDGIGLGLVFVKTVVERHLGTINFSSVVNSGTTFTLALPVYHSTTPSLVE